MSFPLWASTNSTGLVISGSKSPRRFHGLGLKTKWASVCQLRYKTDGRTSAWDTHRDLAACFTLKQVGLGFPSLISRLVEARLRVVHVASSRRSCGVEAEDGQVDTMGNIGPFYPKIVIFNILGSNGVFVFFLGL
jgi:hypothetical protein